VGRKEGLGGALGAGELPAGGARGGRLRGGAGVQERQTKSRRGQRAGQEPPTTYVLSTHGVDHSPLFCLKDASSTPARSGLEVRASSAKKRTASGLRVAPTLAAWSIATPMNSFLTGTSIFLSLKVRGMAGTARMSSGTWRGETCWRIVALIFCFSASSSSSPSARTTNNGI